MGVSAVSGITSAPTNGRARISLIPSDGGSAIEIKRKITVIGRKDFCDVRIDDPSVSKVHLIVARTDGLLLFRDAGSTNGTKVNGQRVIRGALLPNDKLQIASVKYQVQILPAEPAEQDKATDANVLVQTTEVPIIDEPPPKVMVFLAAEELAAPDSLQPQPLPKKVDSDNPLAEAYFARLNQKKDQ